MPRLLSPAATRAVLAQETAQVFLDCLTVSGAGITTFRVVNDTQDLVRGAQTFLAFPFELRLPEDVAEKMPSASIVISNVSRDIVGALRGLAAPATVRIETVLASSPDTVELGPFDFDLTSAEWDIASVRFTLGYEAILGEPFPAGTYNPRDWPGVFG